MLTEIRDRSSGALAWFVAALIIIPMAFFGINQYASTEAQPTIVEIGDEKITQQAFQSQLSLAQSQARQRNPNLANSDIFNSDFYKKQVLDGMINRALARKIADDQQYRVGNDALAEFIKNNPQFQIEGKFDKDAYQAYVRGNFASPSQFEAQIRDNNRVFQVSAGYQESAIVLPDEVRSLLEIQVEKRTFDLITINQADFIEGVEISDADIAEYYEANIDSFMNADRVKIDYVELDVNDIASEIEVDDEQLQQIYDSNVEAGSYTSEETRETSHILLSVSGDNDEEQLVKAEQLIKELKEGADFAELAKQHSQDPGSGTNGGSLGDVERGVMVPEFEEATFSLNEGEISDAVKTQFGYHIIKVTKINGSKPLSFAEVKAEIAQEERDRQAQDVLLERVEQLRNLVFEQADSLAGVASELELEVKSTDLFERDRGIGIASNESVRAAAFSDQVLVDELNSEPVEVAAGVFVALRKGGFEAAAPKPLTEVTAQIKTTLTNERATEAAKQAGDSIVARAESDWGSLANDSAIKIDTHTVSMVDPDRKVPNDVMQEIVKIQLSDSESSKVTSFTGFNGDFNIVRLSKIEPGDVATASEQIKDSTRRLIEQRNGRSLFQSYLQGLNEGLTEQINEDLL